jgi:hypothetical protein
VPLRHRWSSWTRGGVRWWGAFRHFVVVVDFGGGRSAVGNALALWATSGRISWLPRERVQALLRKVPPTGYVPEWGG